MAKPAMGFAFGTAVHGICIVVHLRFSPEPLGRLREDVPEWR